MLGLNYEGDTRFFVTNRGPSVIRIQGWSGHLWANYGPGFPTEIIITEYHHSYHHHILLGTAFSL